jgi:ribosome-associated protein
MTQEATAALEEIVKAIQDKKGFNILVLDVQEISTLTYYFVIAEGRVERHLKAISDEVIDRMEKVGRRPYHVEGIGDGDWAVVDFGDIMIHLFKPTVREKYGLEEVWRESKIVDFPDLELPLAGDSNDDF